MNKKIAVIVHIYYPEIWESLKDCIKNINVPYDLYITTIDENKYLKEDILNFNSDAYFEIVENRGFDVGPFIHIINKINLNNYLYIIKLHTKRNVDSFNCRFRKLNDLKWREELISFVKTPQNFSKCLKLFENNSQIGMINSINTIVKSKYDVYGRKAMKDTKNFLKKNKFVKKPFCFIAGTMFIARSSIFKDIQKLSISLYDFSESHSGDSQLAHVFERLFGYFTTINNYIISDPYLSISEQEKIHRKYFRDYIFSFFFQKKITRKNKLIIKIFKIPVINIKLKNK